MNFDPFDSAAWRAFDMLDADETALFDEAMRHDPVLRSASLEMDRLAAAIAATTALPLEAKAGQLDRLQARLSLIPTVRNHFWLAVAGWAAAAVLATLLTLHLTGLIDQWDTPPATTATAPSPLNPAATLPNENVAALAPLVEPHGAAATPASGKEPDSKTTAKVETKRLTQEIEVLRENLEQFQNRDRALFEVVPGVAVPIVMAMHPPGVSLEDSALTKTEDRSPLTSLLGDALTTLTGESAPTPETPPITPPEDSEFLPKLPTAIPIYDAARDSGTLVVSNLPPAAEGEVYNLWVTTKAGEHPVYVGTLPESSASGVDSFDFSLGSTMVLPAGFVLTLDPQDEPTNPNELNTILQGPPMPTR